MAPAMTPAPVSEPVAVRMPISGGYGYAYVPAGMHVPAGVARCVSGAIRVCGVLRPLYVQPGYAQPRLRANRLCAIHFDDRDAPRVQCARCRMSRRHRGGPTTDRGGGAQTAARLEADGADHRRCVGGGSRCRRDGWWQEGRADRSGDWRWREHDLSDDQIDALLIRRRRSHPGYPPRETRRRSESGILRVFCDGVLTFRCRSGSCLFETGRCR